MKMMKLHHTGYKVKRRNGVVVTANWQDSVECQAEALAHHHH